MIYDGKRVSTAPWEAIKKLEIIPPGRKEKAGWTVDYSAQHDNFAGSLYLEMATIFSDSAIVG